MGKFNFGQTYDKASKEYGLGGGGTFKPKEGQNRVRLISEPLPHSNVFKGKKQFKWLCRVIDRADKEIKLYFMPVTVFKTIEALQTSDDYAFDEIPMPYDIVVNAQNAGTKEVVYSVLPSKETPLTEDEKEKIAKLKPLKEVQDKIFENAGGKNEQEEDEEINTENIPF